MDNKDKNIISNNEDGNINPSPVATWPVTSLRDQIHRPTDHQASSGSLCDIEFDDDANFDLLEMFCDEDFNFGTSSTIVDVIGEQSSVMQLPKLTKALQFDQPELFAGAPALGLNEEVNVNTADDTATHDEVTIQVGQDREEEKVNGKKKKLLNPNITSTKKPELPRYAFVTKSESDVMDDGYKWRKYGRKAVTKSPFARHYYRCTDEGCGLVKTVERSSEDPSTVVTTYVGNHNHIRPVIAPRGSKGMSSKRHGFLGSSSGVGGASLSRCIGGNFSNGSSDGRFSCGMDGSMNGGSGGMAGANHTYNVGAIHSSIGSYAIAAADHNGFDGGSISAGSSYMNLPNYTIEQQQQGQDSYQQNWQQHQYQPNLHNSPTLSSYTFGPATQAAAAVAAPSTTSTSSPAIGSGIISSKDNGFYPLEMYEEFGMGRDGGLLQDIVTSQMQQPKKRGLE